MKITTEGLVALARIDRAVSLGFAPCEAIRSTDLESPPTEAELEAVRARRRKTHEKRRAL